MQWEYLHPRAEDYLGFIPLFLDEYNPAPAKEQFNHNYAHGGGWSPINGFTFDPETLTITYPGDPPHEAVAKAKLRDETIIVYPFAWVLILQPDGSYEVSRMD